MPRVVGQGQICFVLSAIIRVLWDGSRCHHHLLLNPQCLKSALPVLCSRIGQRFDVSVTCSFSLMLVISGVCVFEFRDCRLLCIRGPWNLRTLVYGAGLYSAIHGELIHASVHRGGGGGGGGGGERHMGGDGRVKFP